MNGKKVKKKKKIRGNDTPVDDNDTTATISITM